MYIAGFSSQYKGNYSMGMRVMSQYELIQQLEKENKELKAENRKLSDTVGWMHEFIWDLIKKQRNIQKI